MSIRDDFQHITTELISIFAVLDGFCDSHDEEKKQFVVRFLTDNPVSANSAFAEKEQPGIRQSSPRMDLRRALRDQLYELICMADMIGETENSGLYKQLADYLTAARAFLKTINADDTFVR
jgi:hypothetical protein